MRHFLHSADFVAVHVCQYKKLSDNRVFACFSQCVCACACAR